MKHLSNLAHQFRISIPILLYVWIPTVAILVLVKAQKQFSGINPSFFLDDPYSLADMSPLFGVISNLGILIWCSTAAILLFSLWVLKFYHIDKEWRRFFLYSGLITIFLLFDDLLAIHESLPKLFVRSGRTQNVQDLFELGIFFSYGVIFLSYLSRFRRLIYETRFLIGLSAVGFFFASIVLDMTHDHPLWEEGFKLLGIVSYATYFILLSGSTLLGRQTSSVSS